jgi:hypothetical protein
VWISGRYRGSIHSFANLLGTSNSREEAVWIPGLMAANQDW